MSEDYNGYLIEEQGGHKIVVTKLDDPDFPVTHFRWLHNAKAWIDELPPPEPPPEEGRKSKKK